MKPNLIEAGDISDDEGQPLKHCLLIQCSDAEQVREAMTTGKVSFTVFGAEMEGGQP